MNVWKDINDSNNEIMIVLFENNNHYRLISLKREKKFINIKDIQRTNTSDINLNHNLNDLGNEKFKHNNNICSVTNNKDYYENIYNFLISYNLYTKNNKTDWKKIVYPKNLFDVNDCNTLKNKRRQNFRNKCNKYKIIENKLYYMKKINSEILNLKVPYEIEKKELLSNIHLNQGHSGYIRLYNEIINQKFYWKGIIEDCKKYVTECNICIKQRGGKKVSLASKHIETKGSKERYVVDGWKLFKELSEETGFTWIIDIIDYFSKFMGSFPVKENNGQNALLAIKEFCYLVGTPKIIQTDNGLEYNNTLIDEFCNSNNIKHIKSRPHHPQTNGVVEVVQKEIRRYVLLKYAESSKDFNLKDTLLEAVNIHNHNVHSTTGQKPIDIINNKDEELKNKVLENIKKSLKYDQNKYDNIVSGNHLLIKQNVHKSGKRLIASKFNKKEKIFKLPATVLENYGGGLLAISIDASNYEFDKGEDFIIDYKLCSLISDEQWSIIIQNLKDEDSKNNKKLKKFNKRYRKNH